MRKILATALAAGLLLTGCSAEPSKTSGDAAPLSSIEIKPGADDNTPPTVEFDTPLVATAPGAAVVKEGDGPVIEAGQNVQYKLAGYNTEDGSELGNLFAEPPQVLSMTEEMKALDPEIYEVLVGAKVGSWIAYVRPAEDPAAQGGGASGSAEPSSGESGGADSSGAAESSGASGSAEPSASPSPEPAKAEQVVILKVVGAEDMPEPAKVLGQDEVKKLADEGRLPTVEFAQDGNPTITIPDAEEPGGLAVEVLKEGTGKTVKETDTVTAHYEGVRWEDGKVFDSSYDRGEPAAFPLTQVIEGWTKGLAGQKVGSTVMLTIPEQMAYAQSPSGPQGTLVFVVEIKSVEPAASN